MNPAVKYIAEVRGSREVTLIGTADLEYWRDRLSGEDLYPCDVDGKAELLVSAVASRWLWVRFCELTLSVQVSRREGGSTRDGLFLAAAYNSSRFFAFMERTAFRTPYVHGRIDVAGPASSFKLLDGQEIVIQGEKTAHPTAIPADEVWEGALFLPRKGPPGEVFYARLGGSTRIEAFSPSSDVLTLKPSARHPFPQWLIDSHFVGKEWHLRENATHARSKSYQRTP